MDKRTKLNFMATTWGLNLICFMACLFWRDYAIFTGAWYLDALVALVFATALAKVVLSSCLLVMFFELKKEE